MKIFPVILCLIPFCFCTGQKRTRSEIDLPQDLLAIAFTKGAFKNIPDKILQHIFYYLPFKYQLSFSCVNPFWSDKLQFFRDTNLNHSMNIFLQTTSLPSEVSFKKLLQVIDCFTDYWESLCRNSKNANFLNERPQLETNLGNWLFVNMNQIMSPEWNILLNEEGDTLSYILLQRLLFSPYFYFILKHPIWKAMAAHNEIRVRAACDFLWQVPMMLGKIAIHLLFETSGRTVEFLQVAVKRGIELDMYEILAEGMICTNVIHRELNLLKDIDIQVQSLAHDKIPTKILKFESIILTAIETGSIDIFKDGFIGDVISKNDVNYNLTKEKLISEGFELVYIYPSKGKEVYTMPIVSFVCMKNPAFLQFLFWKALVSKTPKQPQILMYLCSFIPNGFDFNQINVVAIASILWPIVTKCSLSITLEAFCKTIREAQNDIFRSIIKKEVDRLVSNRKAELIRKSYICMGKEIANTSLFFNTVLVFPFLYHRTPTEDRKITTGVDLYFLTKLGVIADFRNLLVSSGQMISGEKLKMTLPPCQLRKLTLPDKSEINVFCQPTYAKQVQKDENSNRE